MWDYLLKANVPNTVGLFTRRADEELAAGNLNEAWLWADRALSRWLRDLWQVNGGDPIGREIGSEGLAMKLRSARVLDTRIWKTITDLSIEPKRKHLRRWHVDAILAFVTNVQITEVRS